jgi:8-oxo-dGTP pyrophosphatase MutT (NUDIX family)
MGFRFPESDADATVEITVNDIRSHFVFLRRREIHEPHLISAGVLVPLFEKMGTLHLLLSRRTESVEHHKGQISFPGGARDQSDRTIIDTALRETEEEIGIQRPRIEVLGVLDDFQTPSGFCITPVVGYLQSIPPLHLNPQEVSEVFDVPLSFFLEKANERVEQRRRGSTVANVYFYRYGNYEIWGATAAMIRSFLLGLSRWIEDKKAL